MRTSTRRARTSSLLQEVVEVWRNRAAAPRLLEERARLRPLPSTAIPSYTRYESKVRRWSTIRVAHRTYSVPARLMGHTVEARVYADVVEVRYHDQVVQTMPRLRKEDEHKIDYRHVIGWLVRKPGAFARTAIARTCFRRSRSAARTIAAGDPRRPRGHRVLASVALGHPRRERPVTDAVTTLLDLPAVFDYAAVEHCVAPPHDRDPHGPHPAPESAPVRCATDQGGRMSRPHKSDGVGDQITALLMGFGVTARGA